MAELTARQRRVVHLLARGKSRVEIGVELGVAERTVKAYCDSIRAKLGVENAREIPAAYRAATHDDPYLEA